MPHDALFRRTFADPAHAGPLLRALLPAVLVAAIDWSTLRRVPDTHIDDDEREQRNDLLFSVRLGGRTAFLYLLLEHKSAPDRWAALQVLGYVVTVWQEALRAEPRLRALPPVLPVIVHFGRRRWRARPTLQALFDLCGVPDAVRAAVLAAMPTFAPAVHDFAQRSEAEVRAMALSLLGLWAVAQLQFVATAKDEDAAAAALAEWADVLRRVLEAADGQQAWATVSSYLLKVSRLGPRRLGVVVGRQIGRAAMKKFVSTYDQIWQGGKAEGKAEGKADLVLRLLRHRFGRLPATVARRVRNASEEDLDRWADRVLDAASLDDVFDAT